MKTNERLGAFLALIGALLGIIGHFVITGLPLFVAVQRMHWIAMIGWGVVTVMILLCPIEWMRVVGLVVGMLEIVVGIPLGIATTIDLGRFSIFSVGLLFSLALVVVFAWPAPWQRLTGSHAHQARPTAQTA